MEIDPSVVDAIDKNNVSLMGRTHAPGMVFGIVKDGKLAFVRGYGESNLIKNEPVTPDTVFRIASVSKIFTAIAIIQLVEQGKINLDDPAEKHLTSFRIRKFRASDPPLTIRHLLTHTAGVGEFAPLLGYLPPNTFFGVGLRNRSLPPLSNLYRGELRPDRSPGEAWSYANHGFATLGQIIADVTGMPFPQAIRQMIFQPLGMDRSDFVRTERVQTNQATGYAKILGDIRPVWDFDIITLADGSLFTTAQDFSKFLGAISTDGGGLIKPSSLEQMLSPQFQLDDHLPSMGLGFMLDNQNEWYGHKVADHNGLWLGFHSSMIMAPQQKLGVFAFVNDGGSIGIQAAQNGLRRLLPKESRRTTRERPQDSPEVWPELVGKYQPRPGFNSNFRLWLTYRSTFAISIEDDNLILRTRQGPWKKGQRLRPADPNNPLVFKADNKFIVFKRNAQGRVDRFCMRYFEMHRESLSL
ncbi:MAG: serine hydrolase domain-containing protein [Anaerolineae bacterium]